MRLALRTDLAPCLLAIGGIFLSSAAAFGEPRDPRLEKILADWQERQHWFQTVDYQVSGYHKVVKGAYNNLSKNNPINGKAADRMSPSDNAEVPVGFTMLLDFAKGRHRRDNVLQQGLDEKTGKFIALKKKDTFNGSVMKCLIPREENPDHYVGDKKPEMSIISGNMKNGEFHINYFPIFFAHGRIYTPMEPILPGQLINKPDPEYLYIDGEVVYEDRKCLLLRTQTLERASTSFEEYWVDTARKSAIVRYVQYTDKKTLASIDMHYNNSHAHWLPESWRFTVSPAGRLLYYDQMYVKHIAVNPVVSDSDFDLEVKPGMLVDERIALPTNSPLEWPKEQISVYSVNENGEREQIPDPYRRPGDQYRQHRQWRIAWLWGVCFVVIILLGIIWTRYRKTSKR